MTKFTQSQIDTILKLAQDGYKGSEIYRKLRKANILPKDTKGKAIYQRVNTVVRRFKNKTLPFKKQASQVKAIESVSQLCGVMTEIILMLKKEYEEADDYTEIGQMVGDNAHGQYSKPIFYFPKKDIRPEFAKNLKNFVDLLKTPAFQGMEGTVLQQKLELSLTRTLNERPKNEIEIPITQ